MKAVLRQVRISPKKVQIIAGLVRNKNVNDALNLLQFTPKKGAKILTKIVKSAAANATNNFKQDINQLYISEIYVTDGPTYKRRMPISRGRTHPILKRTSHITVKINVREPESPKAPEKIMNKKDQETQNA